MPRRPSRSSTVSCAAPAVRRCPRRRRTRRPGRASATRWTTTSTRPPAWRSCSTWCGQANTALDEDRPDTAAGVVAAIWELSEALGIEPHDDLPDLDDEISALVADRDDARARGDYAAADAIRETLKAQGIVLEDTPGGTVWRRVKPDEIG